MRYLLFLFAATLGAATYEVGPGKQYADPLALPWTQMQDGDTIRIYWRAEPYRNLMFIGWSNFSIEGVPGPNGERPIIDGDGAVAVTRGINYYNHDRGLIRIGESQNPPAKLLRNIRIEGLELRNAWRTNATATQPANRGYYGQDTPGTFQAWADNAAGIQATGVDGLIVRNNYIHNAKIGVQVNGVYPARPSSNCLVENNEFASLGGYDDSQSHVLYLECNGEVVRNNKSTQPPTWSSVFKSRGVCTRIENNWIIGGDRAVDLVERAETRTLNPTCPDVVGNNVIDRFDGNDNDAFVHFGGDGPKVENYRTNTLYLVNNTMYSRRGASVMVRVSAWNQNVIALNNVFQWSKMARGGFLLAMHNEYRRNGPNGEKSKIAYGSNWLQKGSCSDPTAGMYLCGRVGDLDATDLGGNVWAVSTGEENKPPSATPVWGPDFRPLYNSPLLDAGISVEGVDLTSGGLREVINGKIDIGALEYGSTRTPGIQAVTDAAPILVTSQSVPDLSRLKALLDRAVILRKAADDAATAAATATDAAKAAISEAKAKATAAAAQVAAQIDELARAAGIQ